MSDKFDAPLRLQLRQIEEAGSGARVRVLVEAGDALTAAQRGRLEEVGLTVQTVAGHIVTGEGTPEAIRQVATLDFVTSLSLSRTRPAAPR